MIFRPPLVAPKYSKSKCFGGFPYCPPLHSHRHASSEVTVIPQRELQKIPPWMARLQNEVGTKDLLELQDFLGKKLRSSPKGLSEKHLIRLFFLRHLMRAILSVRPKCSHRCASLKETPVKPLQILKNTTKNSAEQTAMRTKWFKHIAI